MLSTIVYKLIVYRKIMYTDYNYVPAVYSSVPHRARHSLLVALPPGPHHHGPGVQAGHYGPHLQESSGVTF